LLKMVGQVLNSAGSAAKLEAEGTCQQKVTAAEAELAMRKAAVTGATAELAEAQATEVAQKEKLDVSRKQVGLEEEEYTRVHAEDEEKAKEIVVFEEGRTEVAVLLEAMATKGNGEAIVTYLQSVKAEGPLIAGVRTVLDKEPVDRLGFDLVAQTHLQSFLETKVAEWTGKIEGLVAAKANIHAESLGAWAVKEVAREHVEQAMKELDTAETCVAAAQERLREAEQLETQQDAVLAQCMSEFTLAGDRASQCSTALEMLECLVLGQEIEPEAPAVNAEAMEVDAEAEVFAAKLEDCMGDAEMGMAITA